MAPSHGIYTAFITLAVYAIIVSGTPGSMRLLARQDEIARSCDHNCITGIVAGIIGLLCRPPQVKRHSNILSPNNDGTEEFEVQKQKRCAKRHGKPKNPQGALEGRPRVFSRGPFPHREVQAAVFVLF
ncbi:hypothetical protein F4861DRAFT_540982 [Xylaria intraflava]|nr:hypothetical protein F4861DRAFT_540982 [Xylaria intraflava]